MALLMHHWMRTVQLTIKVLVTMFVLMYVSRVWFNLVPVVMTWLNMVDSSDDVGSAEPGSDVMVV